jgi:hypothetical protein
MPHFCRTSHVSTVARPRRVAALRAGDAAPRAARCGTQHSRRTADQQRDDTRANRTDDLSSAALHGKATRWVPVGAAPCLTTFADVETIGSTGAVRRTGRAVPLGDRPMRLLACRTPARFQSGSSLGPRPASRASPDGNIAHPRHASRASLQPDCGPLEPSSEPAWWAGPGPYRRGACLTTFLPARLRGTSTLACVQLEHRTTGLQRAS